MLYPLKFKPYLKHYPYGGRRFVEVLGIENIPRDRDIAETWEIADHGEEQSVVVNGPLAGSTLRQLMMQFKSELVGDEVWARYGDYFPLLLKFLDCDKRLPAHMHPNDADAERLEMNDTGKTEAWYIVKADEGAGAYCGNLPGLTPQNFREAIDRGDTYDGVMKKVSTTTDETYFVPPGRLHGLDAGNLAFEIQQNSDAGFGWDWAGFVEAGVIAAEDVEPHKKNAIECALYEDGPQEQTRYVTIDERGTERTFCAACRYFVLERWTSSTRFAFEDGAARFNTWTLIGGSAKFSSGAETVLAKKGESLLLPAQIAVQIEPQGDEPLVMLRCYVPDLELDVIEELRARDIGEEQIAWLGSYGAGNDLLPLLGLPQDALNTQ
ncbi:MAG TPA: type I phosphomannose isomerase catalytic subunit [Abditibacteriaceae bacterium]|nr:type I phosphomannose isomerase catalytic subunit [Abditibacteriaceae bacterium]